MGNGGIAPFGASGQLHASGHVTSGRENPVPIGWVGASGGLVADEKTEISCICRGSKPGLQVCSTALVPFSYLSSF
jgi:hypothetical protein